MGPIINKLQGWEQRLVGDNTPTECWRWNQKETMGVDWSHTPETSINYHQAGPNMEPTRKENAQEIPGEKGSPDRHKEGRLQLEGAWKESPEQKTLEYCCQRTMSQEGQRVKKGWEQRRKKKLGKSHDDEGKYKCIEAKRAPLENFEIWAILEPSLYYIYGLGIIKTWENHRSVRNSHPWNLYDTVFDVWNKHKSVVMAAVSQRVQN